MGMVVCGCSLDILAAAFFGIYLFEAVFFGHCKHSTTMPMPRATGVSVVSLNECLKQKVHS